MYLLFLLLSATAHAESVAPSVEEYLDARRTHRSEADICTLAIAALTEYDDLIDAGVDEVKIVRSLKTPAVATDPRAQILETLGACLNLD